MLRPTLLNYCPLVKDFLADLNEGHAATRMFGPDRDDQDFSPKGKTVGGLALKTSLQGTPSPDIVLVEEKPPSLSCIGATFI